MNLLFISGWTRNREDDGSWGIKRLIFRLVSADVCVNYDKVLACPIYSPTTSILFKQKKVAVEMIFPFLFVNLETTLGNDNYILPIICILNVGGPNEK